MGGEQSQEQQNGGADGRGDSAFDQPHAGQENRKRSKKNSGSKKRYSSANNDDASTSSEEHIVAASASPKQQSPTGMSGANRVGTTTAGNPAPAATVTSPSPKKTQNKIQEQLPLANSSSRARDDAPLPMKSSWLGNNDSAVAAVAAAKAASKSPINRSFGSTSSMTGSVPQQSLTVAIGGGETSSTVDHEDLLVIDDVDEGGVTATPKGIKDSKLSSKLAELGNTSSNNNNANSMSPVNSSLNKSGKGQTVSETGDNSDFTPPRQSRIDDDAEVEDL